jgi:hypothetical protein
MDRSQESRTHSLEPRALWALVGALLGAIPAASGCSPKPVIVVQERPQPTESADPTGDRLPVRSPAQIAGDPPPGEDPPPKLSSACDLESKLVAIQRGCERLRGISATGTGAEPAAIAAFDGDLCTSWRAEGLAPQSVTLNLGAPTLVSTILLVPEMAPSRATVRHSVETSDDGRNFQRLGELNMRMTSGEIVELPVPNGVTTRFIRVVTLESPVQVAWFDIAILSCGRPR